MTSHWIFLAAERSWPQKKATVKAHSHVNHYIKSYLCDEKMAVAIATCEQSSKDRFHHTMYIPRYFLLLKCRTLKFNELFSLFFSVTSRCLRSVSRDKTLLPPSTTVFSPSISPVTASYQSYRKYQPHLYRYAHLFLSMQMRSYSKHRVDVKFLLIQLDALLGLKIFGMNCRVCLHAMSTCP